MAKHYWIIADAAPFAGASGIGVNRPVGSYPMPPASAVLPGTRFSCTFSTAVAARIVYYRIVQRDDSSCALPVKTPDRDGFGVAKSVAGGVHCLRCQSGAKWFT